MVLSIPLPSAPLKVEGEPHVLLMVRPIDEQEAAEEDLVYTDVLTSVRNRRYYEEKLRNCPHEC